MLQLSGTALAISVCAIGKLGVAYQVGNKWPDSAMEKGWLTMDPHCITSCLE